MGCAGSRCGCPIGQTTGALGRLLSDRVAQPSVERIPFSTKTLPRSGAACMAKRAHVVKAHPAADDEHPFVTQGREGAPEREVRRGIETLQERQLHCRKLGV